MKFASLRAEYAKLWASMSVKSTRAAAIDTVARRILKNKKRYEAVAAKARVPWCLIGVLHYRESNLNFAKHLHNGDSLKKKTWRVPAGRPLKGDGPFTWEESALDALAMKGLHKIGSWPVERMIYEIERYNGFGYRYQSAGLSPYVWGGSNHYSRGKFVKDGVLDRKFVDPQLGCVPLLKRLAELDDTINLDRALVPVGEAVSKSKSLPALLFGFITWIGTQATDLMQNGWDAVTAALAFLPAIVTGSQEQVGALQTLGDWLSIDFQSTGKWAIVAIMGVVFVRELQRKRDPDYVA